MVALMASIAGPLVAGVIKGGFSAFGQSQANKASQESARESMAFSEQQARVSREFSKEQAGISRDFSHDEAEISRDWQTEMSNTRYQRTMDDMSNAGLNPILAYQQGGGPLPAGAQASTSQAQSAQGQGAQYTAGNIGRDVGDLGVASAVQGARVSLEAKRQKEILHQMRSVTELNYEKGRTEAANQSYIHEQTEQVKEQIPSHSAQRELWKSTTAVNKLQAIINSAEAEIRKAGAISAKETQKIYQTWYGKFLRWIDETGRAVNPFASAGQATRGTFKK